MSNSLRPHGLQLTRLPCPSPTPGTYSSSCQWCHPTIPSSVIPFSFCLQSFQALGSFLMRQFFALGGQSIGVSASASGWSLVNKASSVQFSRSVVSNFLQTYGLQHTRPDVFLLHDGGGIGWGDHFLPPQIHQKIIWMLSNFHKTTSEHWWSTPGTQKSSSFSLKGHKTKHKI